ncbi:hypothetical protein V495_02526 [Pseudogymnoascus sp. VKM F-4514 (FW-929)]|nr:hypothetical protein V495_02526 [Pseudogymnoascus sp. VKM F-4514 (FW-929)]KFY60365.1 hypothetical protein V497_03697 [Pseudogymnoascus sp. VKM F-4516 (FW-969)]
MHPEKDAESAQSSSDADTPPIDLRPDGGLEAWMVVAGVGVFQEYYEKNILKEYSPGTVSWILCLEAFFLMALLPLIGKLFDSAIGASLVFLPPLNCVAGYFDKRRSTAFGIVATGSSTGGLIFPIMVSHLINNIGFPWAMRATALLIFVVLATTNLAVKSRIPPNPSPFSAKEYLIPFKRIAFSLTSFGNILFSFGSFIPMAYLVSQAVSVGMDKNLAPYLVAIVNGSSMIGRIGVGVLADIYGPFNAWIAVTYTVSALILSLWVPAANDASIIAFASLFGICFGAYAAIQPAIVAQITPIEEIGICSGLYFAVASLSQLVSGPIAGRTLEASGGSYLEMKIMAGIFCLAGATFVLGAKLYVTGYKPMAKF